MKKFSWESKAEFVKELQAVGGSGKVTAEVCTGKSKHLGRMPRDYSKASKDEPGRTIEFLCITRFSTEYYCLVLTGVPWANQADYEQAYELLISGGAILSDLTDPEKERALATWQK